LLKICLLCFNLISILILFRELLDNSVLILVSSFHYLKKLWLRKSWVSWDIYFPYDPRIINARNFKISKAKEVVNENLAFIQRRRLFLLNANYEKPLILIQRLIFRVISPNLYNNLASICQVKLAWNELELFEQYDLLFLHKLSLIIVNISLWRPQSTSLYLSNESY